MSLSSQPCPHPPMFSERIPHRWRGPQSKFRTQTSTWQPPQAHQPGVKDPGYPLHLWLSLAQDELNMRSVCAVSGTL